MANKPRRKGKKKVTFKRSATVSAVKKMINRVVETKQVVLSMTNIVPISDTVGTAFLINSPKGLSDGVLRTPALQGVGGYQHIGNKILIKHASVTFNLYQNAPSLYNNIVRMMIVHDFRCQGQAPTTSELLWTVGAGLAIASPRKINQKASYKILWDKTYNFKNSGGIAANTGTVEYKQFKWKKSFPNGLITTYYPDTASTGVGGIQDNSLHLILFANTQNVGVEGGFVNILYQDA